MHIGGTEMYRVPLKDSMTGNFAKKILDDLQESTLTGFFMRSIGSLSTPGIIFMTTDGHHYESLLKEASTVTGKSIIRQRCLFHIEKDFAHDIKDTHMGREFEPAKSL